MRIITNIKNFKALYSWNKDISKIIENQDKLDMNPGSLKNFLKRVYPKKNTLIRNLGTSVLKQLRVKMPFKPEDFSKAKEMYEDYFKMPLHIDYDILKKEFESGKKIYLNRFRTDVPVKGDSDSSYGSYYINGTHGNGTFLLTEMPDEEWYTNLRYATPEEIQSIKDKKILELRNKIKNHLSIISEIQEEIDLIQLEK